MANIRMYRASDDELLDEVVAPSDGTYSPTSLFDLTSLDAVDVYFEMATEPTDEYTTPAFVAPTIASAHISDTQGGTVITEANVGDTLWAVVEEADLTGYPTPTLAYQWEVNGTPPGGTDDEESFDTTGLDDEDEVTVEITVTNGAGSDDATSAAVTVAAASFPSPGLAAKIHSWYRYDAANVAQNADDTGAVTTDGDPVGRWNPTIGSYPLLQSADNSYRPAHNVVSGDEMLEFDNTNDNMRSATTDGTLTLPLNIFVVASRSINTGTGESYIATLTNSSTNYVGIYFRPDNGDLSLFGRLASSAISPTGVSTGTGGIAVDQLQTILGMFGPTTGVIRVDGVEEVSSTHNWDDEVGGAFAIRIGTNAVGASEPALGHNYRDLIILTGALTSDDIAELEAYGASRIPA